MSASLPASIPDSQLGLSASEIHILRQHQQIVLASPQVAAAASAAYAHSTSTRGRGHARSSAATSRATSAASSGQGGRLVLDPGSLAVLGQHFERLMGAIQNRVENVCPPFTLFPLSETHHPLDLLFPRNPVPKNLTANLHLLG